MTEIKRRITPTVNIGNVKVGSSNAVVIQSMTDTNTSDIENTYKQTKELITAGAEMVRWTVNDNKAALAVPQIIERLRAEGLNVPIIGDFHFNGHKLLVDYPACAKSLSKYRINPGNVGRGQEHDTHFEAFIKEAIRYGKPVRIGVNSGSLDQEVLAMLMDENSRSADPQKPQDIIRLAMVKSALSSARYAEEIGLPHDRIVLSVKMSDVQEMISVYEDLAARSDYPLHLGLTEAGGGVRGIAASSAALAVLLHQGIGDTIRVSLTPEPGGIRSTEVHVCKAILQSLGIRYFEPTVISCPGCGRTDGDLYKRLAEEVRAHISDRLSVWKTIYPGVERLKIAVMGCVVNGPGESASADIGICLPGLSETPQALVYADGKKIATIQGQEISRSFVELLEKYLQQKFESRI